MPSWPGGGHPARDVDGRRAGTLADAAQLALADLAEDVAWGRTATHEWLEQLDHLSDSERALADRLVEHDQTIETMERTLARLNGRIGALDGPDTDERADLEIALVGAAVTAGVGITIWMLVVTGEPQKAPTVRVETSQTFQLGP